MGKFTKQPRLGRATTTGVFSRGYVERKGLVLAPRARHCKKMGGPASRDAGKLLIEDILRQNSGRLDAASFPKSLLRFEEHNSGQVKGVNREQARLRNH